MQERIEFCADAMAERWHKSQIKRGFWARFDGENKDTKGKRTSGHTIESYISRARELMHQRFLERAANHADAAIAFLERVIRSPKAKFVEKLKAQEQLTELLGLAAAKKIEVTSSKDGAAEVERKMAQIFGVIRMPESVTNGTNGTRNGNGNGHHEPENVDPVAAEAMG